MPIPITFSAPAPASYLPSVEDSLRDAVWLLMYADDLHRRYYSYDPDDPSKGVNIVAGYPHASEDGFDVPQLVIQVAVESGTITPYTGSAQGRTIHVTVAHFEPPSEEKVEIDVAAFVKTPEALLARTEEILARGTLYMAGMTTNGGKVVDPYNSPRLVDGGYDPADGALRLMNSLPPSVTRARPIALPRRTPRTAAEAEAILHAKDIAIIYGVKASYVVDVTNREDQTHGEYDG